MWLLFVHYSNSLLQSSPPLQNLGLRQRLKYELQNYAVKTVQAFDPSCYYTMHYPVWQVTNMESSLQTTIWNRWQHSAVKKHTFTPQMNMVNNGEKEEGKKKTKGGRWEMEQGSRNKDRRKNCWPTKYIPLYLSTFFSEAYSGLKVHSGSTRSSVATIIARQSNERMVATICHGSLLHTLLQPYTTIYITHCCTPCWWHSPLGY